METFESIINSPTPTLVDFYATWCGPCKAMSPVLDQAKKVLGDKVRILKIDVDKNPAVANKFMVRGVPTFILFKNGELIWRFSGGMNMGSLVKKIEESL